MKLISNSSPSRQLRRWHLAAIMVSVNLISILMVAGFVPGQTSPVTATVLPPESRMPGRGAVLSSDASAAQPADSLTPLPVANQLQSAKRNDLPSEATLPSTFIKPVVSDAVVQPTPLKVKTSVKAITVLPPESVLPNQGTRPTKNPSEHSGKDIEASRFVQAVPPGDDAGNNDGFDAETMGDQRPILRLNYPGHTGRVRALTWTAAQKQLVSAGEDKDIHVWQRDRRDPSRWIHQRTVRWQVWRGPRGWVYDLAAYQNQIAIAGYGAMGGTGEVWIVDADRGQLVRPLVDYATAHRQAVDTVAWSVDGTRLASADLSGRVVVWQADAATGRWQPEQIADEDVATHGPETAETLRRFRGFHPIAWSGDAVVMPTLTRVEQGGVIYPVWRVELVSAQDSRSRQPLDGEILGLLSDLRASDSGDMIVAACHSNRAVLLWRKSPDGRSWTAETIDVSGRPLFARFDSTAKRLLVGTESESVEQPDGTTQSQPASLALFDVSGPTAMKTSEIELAATAATGEFDDVGRSVVLAVNQQLHVHRINAAGGLTKTPTQILAAPIDPIRRVAASAEADTLKVAISRSLDASGGKPFEEVFDLKEVSLELNAPIVEDAYLPTQRLDEKWTVRPSSRNVDRYDLYRGELRVGELPLDPTRHGRPTTLSTAKAADGSSYVCVGTDGQNGIYVFATDAAIEASEGVNKAKGKLPILRYYRGHSGAVRSTSASADARYLFSGGDDSLLHVWNLENAKQASASINRWGGEFALDGPSLIVTEIDEAGPLYFRGVRAGDQLVRVAWPNSMGENQTAEDAAAIAAALADVPFDTQVVFYFSRSGAALDRFQMFPAWYPIATVMIDDDREWAMWTPSGIYNASLSGHRRFGWQLNQGLDDDVDFFTADQFKETLERPAVLRELLRSGSLAAAMRDRLSGGPPPGETAIVNQIRTRPQIRLITPQPGQTIREDSLEVMAEVDCMTGTRLVGVKAFVDGIPGQLVSRTEIASEPGNANLRVQVRWRFELPRQTELRLEVLAVSDAGATDRAVMDFKREFAPRDREQPSVFEKPQLHLLAIGIGTYADPNIQSLDFPAAATEVVANTLRKQSADLYNVTTEQLVDGDATRPLWRIYAESAIDRLRDRVSPDDVVVMYLCGHGLRDRRTGNWYFVTADANYRDLMDDQYADCLSMQDLSLFSSLPCRKIAILDSCHSGAVQSSMREDDLKAIVRSLQDDVVITWTASEGQEEAAEVIEAGLGRFTSALVEALSGRADSNHDGQVMLGEAIDYVEIAVQQGAKIDGMSQHPTASPQDLIRRIEIPLARNRLPNLPVSTRNRSATK